MRLIPLYWLGLLALSGCVSLPREEAAGELKVSPSLDMSVQEGVAKGLVVEALPPCKWWEIFDDATLSSFVEMALINNPSLQEAQAKVEEARQAANVKRAALFPQIYLDAEANAQHLAKNGFFRAYAPTIPGKVTEYTLFLDFTYEYDFWDKWKNLYLAAWGESRAREAEKAQADLIVSSSVAAVYFRLRADMWRFNLLRQQEGIYDELFRLRKRRFAHAIDNANQVLGAENALRMVQQQIAKSVQNIELDKHLLGSLVGEGPEADLQVCQISLDAAIVIPIPESLACDLLAYRPDLMAQIWRVEAAAHEVGAAKADFYPNIDVKALVGFDSVFFDKLFTQGSLASSVAPALHLPIFTAGRIRANLDAKRAILEEAIMAYNRLVLQAARDVADRLADLKAADQTLSLQKMIVQNRRESHQLIERRQVHAISNALENLDSSLEVVQQKWGEAEAQYQFYFAAIELMRSIGGGYVAECIPLIPKGAS